MVAEGRVHKGFMQAGGGCCSDNENAFNNGWADDVVRAASVAPAPDITDASLASGLVDGQFGSSHVGNMNSVFADGSVRVVPYSINLTVFRNLCIRDDGQAQTNF